MVKVFLDSSGFLKSINQQMSEHLVQDPVSPSEHSRCSCPLFGPQIPGAHPHFLPKRHMGATPALWGIHTAFPINATAKSLHFFLKLAKCLWYQLKCGLHLSDHFKN